jgi:hypothetical protein
MSSRFPQTLNDRSNSAAKASAAESVQAIAAMILVAMAYLRRNLSGRQIHELRIMTAL